MARSSISIAMTSGHSRASYLPTGKASGTEGLADLGPSRCWVAIEADLEASPWEWSRFATAEVWARHSGLSRHPKGCPHERVLRLMRENRSALAPSLRAAVAAMAHDGEIITHAPNLMWGTDRRIGCSRVDDRLGQGIFTAVVALERRVCRLACLQGRWRRSFAVSCSRSPWGLPGCISSTAAERGSREIAKPCRMDHGSQYLSDHFTRPDQVLGIIRATCLRLRRRAPDQRRQPSGSIAR